MFYILHDNSIPDFLVKNPCITASKQLPKTRIYRQQATLNLSTSNINIGPKMHRKFKYKSTKKHHKEIKNKEKNQK